MISIDKYAYNSRLRRRDPMQKLVFAMMTLSVCIWAEKIIISIAVIFIMGGMTVLKGGTPFPFFLRLLLVPMIFLLVGVFTIAVNICENQEMLLWAIPFAGKWIGFSDASLVKSLKLFLRALGAVSCLYFLSLNTPMVDLLAAFRRLGMPKVFVELMELVYRFIFSLMETADTIYNAQNCRLGYSSLCSSYRSLAIMASMLFIKSYKQSKALYTALEARGYEGEINVLEEAYESHWGWYIMAVAVNALLVLFVIALKSITGGLS
ncbi:cobalt ECF transporter T component CbiQ [Lutispora thermophila]|uniref:Cobalt/nickel transport system permease protein n=1 Tax=Lutispora thermophila DSM 19022 TaxID=1122184 RepID=A0A1M6D3H9_9FIRM|nr:cobalt ECF transporter T component CbiQ [Lutispora thermophila]SHI67634.1 cobalt/nickel transport system permease protein [Lutispora thermophila DSM 19022]